MSRSGMNLPGYGEPHPDAVAFLSEREPTDVRSESWTTAGLRLTVSSYLTTAVPPVLVGSARCILWEAGRIIVCSTPDGPSVTPGGRLDKGETCAEAACREVYEETGRSIAPSALRYLGFVHYRHRNPMRAGSPYPYPDFFQVIYDATVEPEGDGNDAWVDLADDGWVLGHWLATEEEAQELGLTGTERLFLRYSRER